MTDIRVAAEQARVALQCICSHGSRTPREIDADWDFARAALASLEAALAALPGDKELMLNGMTQAETDTTASVMGLVHPAVNDAEQGSQIAGRDGASAAPSDEGSARGITDICLPNGVLFDAFGNKRVRYVRVIHDGTTCVVPPQEVESLVDSERAYNYRTQDVYLSKEEFDGLPEFDGF